MYREPPVRLELFEGMLFGWIHTTIGHDGVDAGFGKYYDHRANTLKQGFAGHERRLAEYLWQVLPPRKNLLIVHAGIGIGTLTCLLAVWGYNIVGIERDRRRLNQAQMLRSFVIGVYPKVADRYSLILGQFPDCVRDRPELKKCALLFTNVAAGWREEQVANTIAIFPQFRWVILDLRLFGRIRAAKSERLALREKILTLTRKWRPIGRQHGIYYSYFRF